MTTVANIVIHDAKTTQNGTRVAGVKTEEGELVYLPDEFMAIPFNPSTFLEADSTRKNLLVTISEPLQKEFARLDVRVMVYLTEHSERILKKHQTLEQVRSNYVSCVRTS